ncbi:MAG: acyl-CoA dehydrogenase family protein [Acidimicrobiia bacterium]
MADATTELPDLDEYRAQARAWLEANLERRDPNAQVRLRGTEHRTHETIKPEKAIQRKLYDGGYAGITWPKEYGGQGLPASYERVFNEEARGYRTPDLGVAGGTTFGICVPTMLQHASPEYLQNHIPKVLAGEELWVQFFSEPGAGSDLAGVTTKAEKDGDRWILNGSKIWSSGAAYADWGMCLARTNWDVPKHRGLTWFAVKIDQPGVEVLPVREINGDAEFCQEFFDDVELTDDDMIGELNQGWTVANTMLVFERGAGRGEELIPRPTGRRQLAPDLVALAKDGGREKDPYVRQLIAKAHINDFATGQLGARIGDHIRAGSANAAGIASYGKLFSGTFQPVRARIGMEIGQGAALTWDEGDLSGMATSLNYLNGRVMSIAGGTNEVQRNGVGERVLGLPREPSFDTDRPFRDVVRDATNWTGKTTK